MKTVPGVKVSSTLACVWTRSDTACGSGLRGAAVHRGGPIPTAAHAATVAGQSVAILGGCGDASPSLPPSTRCTVCPDSTGHFTVACR